MAISKLFFPSEDDKVHNHLIDVLTALGVVKRSQDLKRGPKIYMPGVLSNVEVIVEAGNGPPLETAVLPIDVLGTFEVTEVGDDSFSA